MTRQINAGSSLPATIKLGIVPSFLIGVDAMCEPRGVKDTIRDIPFKVAALADVLPMGSSERSLARTVAEAIRADCEYALKRLESGLKD